MTTVQRAVLRKELPSRYPVSVKISGNNSYTEHKAETVMEKFPERIVAEYGAHAIYSLMEAQSL